MRKTTSGRRTRVKKHPSTPGCKAVDGELKLRAEMGPLLDEEQPHSDARDDAFASSGEQGRYWV